MTDLRAAYRATRILVTNHGQAIDLDDVPDGGLAAAVAPLVPPICVVTAWNSMSDPQPLDVNEAANCQLESELESRGLPWLRAEGRSADGTWSEGSFAIDHVSVAEARDLGRRWGQRAVFYVTDREVAVMASDGEFRDIRRRGRSEPTGE